MIAARSFGILPSVIKVNNGIIINFGRCPAAGCTLPLAYTKYYAANLTMYYNSSNGYVVRKSTTSTLTNLVTRWDTFASAGGAQPCNFICIGF